MRRYCASDKMPYCDCCTLMVVQSKHGRSRDREDYRAMRRYANRTARAEGKREIEAQLLD